MQVWTGTKPNQSFEVQYYKLANTENFIIKKQGNIYIKIESETIMTSASSACSADQSGSKESAALVRMDLATRKPPLLLPLPFPAEKE